MAIKIARVVIVTIEGSYTNLMAKIDKIIEDKRAQLCLNVCRRNGLIFDLLGNVTFFVGQEIVFAAVPADQRFLLKS